MVFSEDPSKPLKTGYLRVNAQLIHSGTGAYESKGRVFESRRAHSKPLRFKRLTASPSKPRLHSFPLVPRVVPKQPFVPTRQFPAALWPQCSERTSHNTAQ